MLPDSHFVQTDLTLLQNRVWQDGYGGRNRKSSIFNLGSDSNSDSDVGAPGIGSVGLSGSVLHDM
ncbi:unnamed protein product [Brugia pahangi]|uniref:Uncharacterized protein n=1 Tax=Brugia pahangi TaxID=6280 RepID=A0A0N4T322_BRUPA|nr:unnamed protein product [Brugia pahangi]